MSATRATIRPAETCRSIAGRPARRRLREAQRAPEHAELAGVVPYGANRFALLLNDIDAIHGVSPRTVTVHPRRLVNIIAEVYPTVERLFDERPYQEKTSVFSKLLARAGLAS
jgi:hypothetical protein